MVVILTLKAERQKQDNIPPPPFKAGLQKEKEIKE